MKKLFTKLFLLVAMVMMGVNAWAVETNWSATSFSGTVASNSIKVNDVTWTMTDYTVSAGTPVMAVSSGKLKFGSSKSIFFSSYTISSDDFSGYNVSKVVVGCYDNGGTESEIIVKQGDVTIGSATVSTTTTTNTETLNNNEGEGGTLTITYTSTKQASYITSITVYYDNGLSATLVTGVSLDKTNATVYVGRNTTLTATIAPADATDKTISWSSNNESVATVDDGVVTGVAAGTATITATTKDGNYTASCVVTVEEFSMPGAFTLVFNANSTNSDGSSSYSTASKLSDVFADESYIFVNGISAVNNVYPARNSLVNGVKFGTASVAGSITLTLAEPVNATKIIVSAAPYGDSEGQDGFTINGKDVPMAAGKNKVYRNYEAIFDGSSISEITLTQKTAKNGRIYVESIQVISTPITGTDVTITSAGYSTFFDSTNAVKLPTGVQAGPFTAANGLKLTYEAGDVVPAGVPVVLKAEAGTYTLTYTTGGTTPEENDLLGTDVDTNLAADASSYFYGLSTGTNGVGFYWLAAEGAAFANSAHKAYLKVAKSASARTSFGFDGETAISTIENEEAETAAFNLAGQRVENAKGLVIKNGKKMYIK